MSRYVHDRTGTLQPAAGSATRYELRSVAVPFGNCVEPSNVKAGGKQCPIRFQCSGCGFYRPDPSYLPAIEEHITALKADQETALAMDAEEFVVRNLADQTTAFAQVAEAMQTELQSLPDAERTEVEQASIVLRKMRASRAADIDSHGEPRPAADRNLAGDRPLLPLTVAPSASATQDTGRGSA